MSGSVIQDIPSAMNTPNRPSNSKMPYAKTLINLENDKTCQKGECFCIETEYDKGPNDTFHIFKRTERPCTRNKDCLKPGDVYYDDSSHTHATTYCDVDNKFNADGLHCEKCLYTNIKNAQERSIIQTMYPYELIQHLRIPFYHWIGP